MSDREVLSAWVELDKAMRHADSVRRISRHGEIHPAEYSACNEAIEHSLIDITVAVMVLKAEIARCVADRPEEDRE